MTDALESAQQALDLVGEDPRAALEAAGRVVAALPRAPRDPEQAHALSMAERAAGVALRYLGEPIPAEQRLRRAVQVAERAGLVEPAAEARTSLAYVLLLRGKVRSALALVDEASAETSGVVAARVRATRALILQHSGRTAEALQEYAAALPVLQRAGDALWESRMRGNRGLLHAYLGDTDLAVADLTAARELASGLGLTDLAASMLLNLAWVLAMSGSVREALELFDVAAAEAVGVDRGEHWVDRAQVLLQAGLTHEALEWVERAVQWYDGRGLDAPRAEAVLLLAQCQSVLGRDLDARANAEAAARSFRRQDRSAWSALADYVALLSVLRSAPTPGALDRISRAASVLRDAGWEEQAADLRIEGARAAVRLGDARRAKALLGPLAAQAGTRRPWSRTRVHLARAMLCELSGDDTAQEVALRRAWAAAAEQRALLGATDLRAAATSRAADIVAAGIHLGLARGSAAATFAWSERARGAALRPATGRPPSDDDLARALTRLRWAVRAQSDARLDGEPHAKVSRSAAAAERAVVALARRGPARSDAPPGVSVRQLAHATSERALVCYAVDGAHLTAVVVAGGRATVHRLAPLEEVAQAADTALFAQRRVALGFGSDQGQEAAGRALAGACATLDRLAVAPLAAILADRPRTVCPATELLGVPWPLLSTIARAPVTVAPSATSWWRANATSVATPPRRVVVVVGPGVGTATEEVAGVLAAHGDAVELTGADAKVATLVERARGADLLHLAAHGHLRRDNPLFSSLDLADGPLTGYDIETMTDPPATVVLSSCSTAAVSRIVAEQTFGVAWAFVAAGTRSVVAPVLPVADAVVPQLMSELHQRIARGEPPSLAMHGVHQWARSQPPAIAATAAAFTVVGV